MDTTNLSIILSAQDKTSAIFSGVLDSLKNMGLMGDDAAKKLDKLGDSSAKSGTKLRTGVALAAAGVTAAVLDIGAHSVKMAADFQTMTTTLVTTAGESERNLASVRTGILNISTATGTSAEKLSTAMYTIESAGFHGAAGLTILKAAAQGAKTENADLEKVADAVTSSMRDYHLPASDAATVTSKLVAAVGAGKSTFEGFTGALHSVLPTASAAHVSLDDVLGSMASMTVHGMSADQAAQNLSHSILKMQSPTSQMTNELAQLGIKSSDLSDMLGKKGISGTLQTISEAIMTKMGPSGKVMLDAFNGNKVAAADMMQMIAAMPPKLQTLAQAWQNGAISQGDYKKAIKDLPTDQAQLMTQFTALAGKAKGFSGALKAGVNTSQSYSQAMQAATGDATTLNVALMTTGENAGYTNNAVKAVGKASAEAGGNVAGWSLIQGNFNQKMSQAKEGLHNTGIAIGSALLPPLTAMMGVIVKVVTPIAAWVTTHQKLAAVILASVGAFSALVAVILTINKAFLAVKKAAEVIKLITGLQKLWNGVMMVSRTVMLGFNAVMAMSPITWIIIAVVAFIAVMVLLIVKCKPVREFFEKLWKDLKQWFADGVNWIKKHWALLVEIILGPMGFILVGIIQHWKQITKAFKTAMTDIEHFLKAAWNIIKKVFEYAFLIILGLVVIAVRHIYDAIKGPMEAIWHFLVTVWNTIYGVFKTVLTAIWNFVWDILQREYNGWKNILTAIWNVVVSVWNAVYGFVAGILKAIWNQIVTAWNFYYGIISGVLRAIWSVVSSVWNSVWGFISGILHSIWSVITSIWNACYSAVSNALSNIWSAVRSIWNDIRNFFAGAGTWLLDAGKNLIMGLVNGIKGAAGAAVNAAKSVAKDAISAAKSFLGIHSPSTVFMEIGDYTMQGMQKGIEDNAHKVTTATANAASATVQTAKKTITQEQADAQVRPAVGAVNTGSASNGSGAQINLTVKVGMYAGTTSETNQIAEIIWQAMNRIANTHNLKFPQIGILPN